MIVSYLQEWFVPGESDLFPIAVVLLVIGFLLGKRVPQETQGTMVVSGVLIFLVGSVVQNMLRSMMIDLCLMFFTGIAVALIGGMLLRDIVSYFRKR